MRQHTVFKSALIALACSAVAIHAVAGEDKQVNVPAGDLIAALKTLAQQSGADLVYRSDQLEGLRTQGVSGTLSAQEAVTKLLEGTTLTLKTDSSGAMLIALPRASTAPSVTGTQNDHSAAGADNQPTADVSEAKRGFWGRFRLAQLDQTRTAEDGSVKTSETAAARKPESQLKSRKT